MATCPNKNLDSWKNLVATRGENAAYVLWDTYEGDFPEEDYKKSFSQKISDSKYNKLIKFLDTLRITTEFNADEILDNLNFKNSPLAAFDILQRYLAFRKGAEDLLPEQVANVAYSFLGKKSKLGKDLWININKWSEYQKYYDQFTKEKYVSDEGFVYEDDMDLGKPSFDSFAHKRVIVKFLELGLLGELGERSTSKSRLNVDIDAEYFKSRGRKNPYEGTALEKLWARFYNYMQDLFGKKIFEEYDDKKLRDLALDIVDDIYKEDYKKFIRGIYESDGKLYKSDGKELEVKYYEETLEKDLGAKEIIQSLVRNPYIGFKLSGSQTLRKYGKLYRPLEEDLHDIDGVIPLDTFRKDPNSFAFKDWIQNVGLRLSPKQFFKEVEPRLENLNWFVNLKAEYPNFKMTNAFIGKDHARGESVTITGYIEDPTQKVINPKTKKEENKKYVLDFFLRTDEGNYPEIFDNYWKDWKQIFEAKLNMGRSKDLADLIYFDPFLEDKFKFTNKGFRYFSFPEGVKEKSTIEETPSEAMFQMEGMPSSIASPELISRVKEILKKMGVDVKALSEYVKEAKLDIREGVNGLADLTRKLIAVAEGKEDVALTEEMVHIATAIIEQKNPKLVTEMISKIDRFKMYKQVYEQYKGVYLLPNGKPDIRKIKKEAVDKLISEIIVNKNEETEQNSELREEDTQLTVRKWWNAILDWIRGMYRKSNISIFEEAAEQILAGEVGGVAADIKATGVMFQLTDKQQSVLKKLDDTKNSIEKVVKEETKDSILADSEEVNNYYRFKNTLEVIKNRVTDRVKRWYKNNIRTREFTLQEKVFNEIKRVYGVQGHKDFEDIHNRYYHEDGTKRNAPLDRPTSFDNLSEDMYEKLENYYVDLIKTFREGTIIRAEVMIYDPKNKEAGTIDFLAIEPSGKAHILDWKFMHIMGDDVAWFKKGAFDVQLGTYKKILRENYGIKEFGMTRAIPISMSFKMIDKNNIDAGYRLGGIAIGSADPKKIEDVRLVPISEETESTGYEALDDVINKLNGLLEQIGKEEVTDEQSREFKIERLNILRKAIRLAQGTLNVVPLIDVIEVMRKEGDRILNDYNALYKDRPASSTDSNNADLSDFADDMNNYMKLSDVFTNVARQIGDLIYEEGMLESAKTEEEQKDALKRKETLNRLKAESDAIFRSREAILKASLAFADKHIGERNLTTGLLSPEKPIKGLSSLFRGAAELPSKALQVLTKLTGAAQSKAASDALAEVTQLMEIRKRIVDKGGDIRRYVQQIYQKDDKGQMANRLVHRYSKEFHNTVDEKHEKGGDLEWLNENIDMEGYRKEAAEVMKRSIDKIEKNRYSGTAEEERKTKDKLIEKVKKEFDIDDPDFSGWNNYIIKRHPLEKWYSEEYRKIMADKDLFELYNFIVKFNEKANDIGYIQNQVTKTFLPFIRKSMAEELVWNNRLSVMQNFYKSLQLNPDDTGYGEFNKVTGELENSIPKYYTYDFTKKENGVNDYSEVSEDLFKNLILYIQQVNKYKYMTEVEGQLKLVKTIEEFKDHLAVDRSNNVVMVGEKPQKIKGNEENAKMFDDFLRVILYEQKYVLSDADLPLNIDKVLNFVKKAVNKVARREVWKETEQPTATSLIKTIDAANRAFQLKTLGFEFISGAVNAFGGNIQVATQAGNYFKAREFAANEAKLYLQRFESEEDRELFVQLVNTFMPLKDDPSYEMFKGAGMSKLTRGSLSDTLFFFMRQPEILIEKSIFLSLLQNTMVVDGKIVSIREFVKSKYKDRYTSAAKYNEAKDKIEKEIEELKKTSSIATTRKLENGKLVIPGLDLNNREELQRLTNLSRRIAANATGAMTKENINRMSMSVWTKSMMVFKNWIPKLADTRFGEFRKVVDDFSVRIDAEEGVSGEKYDVGRIRLLFYFLGDGLMTGTQNLKNIIYLNDAGIKRLDEAFEDFRQKYEAETGETLNMSREEFIDLIRTNVRNQIKELLILGHLVGMTLALGFVAPDDDEDKATKNLHRYAQRVVDKFVSELSFFYLPSEMEKTLSGGIFPAVGLAGDFNRFMKHFFMETTGMDMDPQTTYDEVRKKAQPVKNLMKMFPFTKSLVTYLAIFSEEFAKEYDVTIQKETRR